MYRRCCRINRIPYIRCTNLFKATFGGCPVTLHTALEPKPLCGLLQDTKKKEGYRFYIADPASQLVTYSQKEFEKCWFSTKEGGEEKRTTLALMPTPEFETHFPYTVTSRYGHPRR